MNVELNPGVHVNPFLASMSLQHALMFSHDGVYQVRFMSIEKEVFPFMAQDRQLFAFDLEGTRCHHRLISHGSHANYHLNPCTCTCIWLCFECAFLFPP